MLITVVRHGQSEGNVASDQGLPDRTSDPALTELGRQQAQLLADWPGWQDLAPTRLFSSLLRRTIETADPLGTRLGLATEARADLFECGGPAQAPWDRPTHFPGSPRSVLQALGSNVVLPEESTEEGWFPGPLERPHRAMLRALQAAQWLGELDEPSVVVVCHGAFGCMLLNALVCPDELATVAADPDTGAEDLPLVIGMHNTSTSVVDVAAGRRARVGWVNRVDHLVERHGSPAPWLGEPWPPRPTPSADGAREG